MKKSLRLIVSLCGLVSLISCSGVIVDHNLFLERMEEHREKEFDKTRAEAEFLLETFEKTKITYNFSFTFTSYWKADNNTYKESELAYCELCGDLLNENPLALEEIEGHKYRYFVGPLKYIEEIVVQEITEEEEITEYYVYTRTYNDQGRLTSYKGEYKLTTVVDGTTTASNETVEIDISYKG